MLIQYWLKPTECCSNVHIQMYCYFPESLHLACWRVCCDPFSLSFERIMVSASLVNYSRAIFTNSCHNSEGKSWSDISARLVPTWCCQFLWLQGSKVPHRDHFICRLSVHLSCFAFAVATHDIPGNMTRCGTSIVHDERMIPIDFQGQGWNVKVPIDIHENNLVNNIQATLFSISSSNFIQVFVIIGWSLLIFKVRVKGQGHNEHLWK